LFRDDKVEFATARSLEDGGSNPFTIRPVLFQYLGFPIKPLRIRWKTAVYSTSSTSKSSVPKVHPFALKSSEKVVRIFEGSKRQTCLDVDLKKNERIFEADKKLSCRCGTDVAVTSLLLNR